MREDIFEALEPVCPHCLHQGNMSVPLKLADVAERRGGLVWFGTIHCTNSGCWQEYPIIDGVALLTPNPSTYIANTRHQIMARDDLPPSLEAIVGDACGQGSEVDTTRHHLSLYARTHYADWGGEESDERPCIAEALDRGLAALDPGASGAGPGRGGLAVDLGGSVGRGGWELAARRTGPVIVADLNFAMLRLAMRLMLEGEATFSRRRIGLVYDPVTVRLPHEMATDRLDLWLTDVMRMPLRPGSVEVATALNLVDCVPAPTNLLAEIARCLEPGGGCVLTTPYDWQSSATEPAQWFGGHSDRAEGRGAAEPVLRATLSQVGLEPVGEALDLPWRLRLHARSVMHYGLHLVAARPAR